jgi:glycosyltransferase involved in cell wall biosynthesis
MLAALARWDAATAGRVDTYVAISQHVASRIRRYYNRASIVIYPPVDTKFFCPETKASAWSPEPADYLLMVSALVPYKRIDLAIEASQLSGVPLRIVGDGPERSRLMKLAADGPAKVEFLGSMTDEEIRRLYRRAAAVLLPGEEDFGIAPVEAQACGRPVIALGRGGALETVVDGVTGVLVDESSPKAFADAIARARQIPFDPAVIRQHALKFDAAVFARSIQTTIENMAHA